MKIGAYDVIRVLGKGGMSEVYEAENPRLGSRHALKVYTYRNDDPDVRRRFDVEGRPLVRLGHPRIVKVTDIGETDARTFGISRNSVSQIKTRIDKRIVSVGRELIRGA